MQVEDTAATIRIIMTPMPVTFFEFRRNCVKFLYKSWAGQPRNRGSIPSRGKRLLLSPKRPDKLYSSCIVLLNR